MTEGFSGENKCTVMPALKGPEYESAVKRGAAAKTKAPVCASQSVRAGDSFCVLQVGTVGVAGPPATSIQEGVPADHRTFVQHTALVLVRPANGSMQRNEVFTAEQMRTGLGQVEWKHSGLLPMNPREVRLHTTQPAPCIAYMLSRHISHSKRMCTPHPEPRNSGGDSQPQAMLVRSCVKRIEVMNVRIVVMDFRLLVMKLHPMVMKVSITVI